MKNREQEYRELFVAEALETVDVLARHLATLEQAPADVHIIADSFRLLHNLKATAAATGAHPIAALTHSLETVFEQLRAHELPFSPNVGATLFEAVDALTTLVEQARESVAQLPAVSSKLNLPELLARLAALQLASSVAPVEDLGASAERQPPITLSDRISIPMRKLNKLLNLSGEMAICGDQLQTFARELGDSSLRPLADHLFQLIEDLQFSVMDMRLVEVGVLFDKLPRVVHDVGHAAGKQVALELSGRTIQIDRNVQQLVADALLHLLRNAVVHGIETPAERVAAGKPPVGTVRVAAATDRNHFTLTISDNGRGLDQVAIWRQAVAQGLWKNEWALNADQAEAAASSLIFEPGFSTVSHVTEYAGRGVGLDVVKRAVEGLGGHINLETQVGRGTTFTLVLPAGIAVKPALLVEEDATMYALPLAYTEAVFSLTEADVQRANETFVTPYLSEELVLVPLRRLLQGEGAALSTSYFDSLTHPPPWAVVVVVYNNQRIGLVVERSVGQQDIVIQQASPPLQLIDLYNGLTTLGNGRVCVVLDVPALLRPLQLGRQQVLFAARKGNVVRPIDVRR
jgi:two-component system, chemotaxis family, sensor kinase CheA